MKVVPDLSRISEDPWNRVQVQGGILWIVRFWGAVTALLFLGLFLWFMTVPPPPSGRTRENLSGFLRERTGLSVHSEDVVVAGGLRPGFSAPVHRVVFLGSGPPRGIQGLYLAHVRISGRGIPVALESLQRLGDNVDHHEEQAAVTNEWVVWISPSRPGHFHLVFLPDPENRWDLVVEPVLENPVVFFEGNNAVVAGRLGGSSMEVRVDLANGQLMVPENMKARLIPITRLALRRKLG